MSQLTVELVAADRKVWEGPASQVSARSIDGELGILPGHTPMLAVLAHGEVRIHHDGTVGKAEVDGGILSVNQNFVTIVAEGVDASGLGA